MYSTLKTSTMAYKITFDKKRQPVYTWTDRESWASNWRKEEVILNEIIIKPTGRSVHSIPFRKNIIYTLYDYGIFPKSKKKYPLEIVVIFKNDVAVDIAVSMNKKPQLRPNIHDVLGAILLADKEYTKVGGGVFCKKPHLHENKQLQNKLFDLITSLLPQNQ